MRSFYYLMPLFAAGFFGCNKHDNSNPKAAGQKNYIAQNMPQNQNMPQRQIGDQQMGNQPQQQQQQQQNMNFGRTDEDIRILGEIRNKLQSNRQIQTDTNKIQVFVNSGIVTLHGQVTNQIDKIQIESDVRSINGVRGVNSQILVTNR